MASFTSIRNNFNKSLTANFRTPKTNEEIVAELLKQNVKRKNKSFQPGLIDEKGKLIEASNINLSKKKNQSKKIEKAQENKKPEKKQTMYKDFFEKSFPLNKETRNRIVEGSQNDFIKKMLISVVEPAGKKNIVSEDTREIINKGFSEGEFELNVGGKKHKFEIKR